MCAPGVYACQWEVGERLFHKALELLKDDSGDVPEYQGVMFFVITASFNTLKQQTNDRLDKEGLRMPEKDANGKNYEKDSEAWLWNLGTITYTHSAYNTKAYEAFRKHAFEHPETLHVIVADECHSAITLNGAYDYYVNDRFSNGWSPQHGAPTKLTPSMDPNSFESRQGQLLEQRNVLTLLVSATPFNVVSSKSYLDLSNNGDLKDEDNIVYWFDGPSSKTTWVAITLTHHALPCLLCAHPRAARRSIHASAGRTCAWKTACSRRLTTSSPFASAWCAVTPLSRKCARSPTRARTLRGIICFWPTTYSPSLTSRRFDGIKSTGS